jgi:hypothetical protein
MSLCIKIHCSHSKFALVTHNHVQQGAAFAPAASRACSKHITYTNSRSSCSSSTTCRAGSADDDNEDEDDEDTSRTHSPAQRPRMISYGLQSRSPPSTRKALGSGSKGSAKVYVCQVKKTKFVSSLAKCSYLTNDL